MNFITTIEAENSVHKLFALTLSANLKKRDIRELSLNIVTKDPCEMLRPAGQISALYVCEMNHVSKFSLLSHFLSRSQTKPKLISQN